MNERELIRQRLAKVIKDSNTTYREIEEATGISHSTVQRYVTGATKKIPTDHIQMICNAIGANSEYVTGFSDKNSFRITETEKEIVLAYRNNKDLQIAVRRILGIGDSK